jgi:hypothetical protein
MSLLPDQISLLDRMVEGSRGVPRTEQEFTLFCAPGFGSGALGKCSIRGPGLEDTPVMAADVWELVYQGYLHGTVANEHVSHFVVTAAGFEFYEERRNRPVDPAVAVEQEIVHYVEADQFQARFPGTHEKLRAATGLLWKTSPSDDLTTIGHLLREGLQRFATEMVDLHQPSEVDPNPDHTQNRLLAVVEMRRDELGDRRADLLAAIATYLDAVNGVIQRLEHADQKEGDRPTWEDARAACFQTINLVGEFDRILNGARLAHR